MAEILYGKPVAAAIKEDIKERAAALTAAGHTPCVAILRAGDRSDDLAYERRVLKLCDELGIEHRVVEVSREISHEDLMATLKELTDAPEIDGILVFRPLPKQVDEDEVCRSMPLSMDIDRMNPDNLKILFTELDNGYAPCTPEAVIEILKFYGINMDGANVAIVNRSLVLGRPLSMMFLKENSTVTICHSHTKDLPSITKAADIFVSGIGRAKFFGPEYIGENTVVVDVGINFADGKMTGDVDFEPAAEIAKAITPVPGGVGAVTSSLLLRHLVDAAEKKVGK